MEHQRTLDEVTAPKPVRECKDCGVNLTDRNWPQDRQKNYVYLCNNCIILRQKKYFENRKSGTKSEKKHHPENRERIETLSQGYRDDGRIKYQKYKNMWRKKVLDAKGGRCELQGETHPNPSFFDFHAINGHPRDKKGKKLKGQPYYSWCLKNLDEFQVLCPNCHRLVTLELLI